MTTTDRRSGVGERSAAAQLAAPHVPGARRTPDASPDSPPATAGRAPASPPTTAARQHDDPHPAPVILTACTDGPILVRGEVEILDSSGRPVPRRRATVALCRCGASAIKPFCDGSHKAIGFRTDDEVPRPAEPVPADEATS